MTLTATIQNEGTKHEKVAYIEITSLLSIDTIVTVQTVKQLMRKHSVSRLAGVYLSGPSDLLGAKV